MGARWGRIEFMVRLHAYGTFYCICAGFSVILTRGCNCCLLVFKVICANFVSLRKMTSIDTPDNASMLALASLCAVLPGGTREIPLQSMASWFFPRGKLFKWSVVLDDNAILGGLTVRLGIRRTTEIVSLQLSYSVVSIPPYVWELVGWEADRDPFKLLTRTRA